MKVFAAIVIVVAGIISVAAAHEAGVGPFANSLPVNLPAPSGLTQTVAPAHTHLPTGQWTRHGTIHFATLAIPAHPNFRLQIELARGGAQASNRPAATGSGGVHPGLTIRRLGQGSYQWWARFYDGTAVSRWVPYSSGTAFKVDVTPPSTPVISSSTDPVQNKVYRSGTVSFAWNSTDAVSGVKTYRTWFGTAGTQPQLRTQSGASMTLHNEPTGKYRFEVRAEDMAGNWSKAAIYELKLDSTPPSISNYGFSTFAFNPHYTKMTFNYVVTQPATVRIGIYNQSTGKRVRMVVRHSFTAKQLLHYTWRGRDNQSHIVPPGMYTFAVRTTDAYGASHLTTYSNLQVLDKVIVVSISQQKLWAYQDGHSVLSTLVTTGNVNCCATPTGLYTILGAYHPFTFVSPFPKSSYLYYEPSQVNYALLFDDRGYYIHDAPWRSNYGPGTNQVPGTPGTPDTGTHGCVNVPLAAEEFLFKWAPVGTPVKILG